MSRFNYENQSNLNLIFPFWYHQKSIKDTTALLKSHNIWYNTWYNIFISCSSTIGKKGQEEHQPLSHLTIFCSKNYFPCKIRKYKIFTCEEHMSNMDIEGIRTVFVLYFFFMKDILNVKNTNKSTSSNFYPYNIHKQKHLSNFHLDNMS